MIILSLLSCQHLVEARHMSFRGWMASHHILLKSCEAISLKLCAEVENILKMCMYLFEEKSY